MFQVAADYCAKQRIGVPAELKNQKVILNQNARFREGKEVRLDGGSDSVLKDISPGLNIDLRERLVDLRLTPSGGQELVTQLCGGNTLTTENAVAKLIGEIERRFSAGALRGPEAELIAKAATKLVVWFAANASFEAPDLQSFPLVCADGKMHRVSDYHEALLVPTALMSESDRKWLDLFPQSVRLADSYLRVCDELEIQEAFLAAFLTKHELASTSLVRAINVTSDDNYLSAMYRDKAESGHKVESLSATDIAGFTRLLSDTAGASSSGKTEPAKRVLEFILSYAAVKDDSWRSTVLVPCTRPHHGCAGSVELFPSAWLAKAKRTPWVPNPTGDGAGEPLSSRNIKEMWEQLPPEASQSQAAREFLALHFGIDRLEMAIRASAGDDVNKREELRNELAAVVDSGIRPGELQELIRRHQTASAINTRNGKLGRIVETLVDQAFVTEGFDVEQTGVGSDFRVRISEAKDLELDKEDVGELSLMARYRGVAIEFLVEVKATQGDVVRMSWRQAEKAAANVDQYILCVVDFSEHLDLFDRVLEEDEPTHQIIADCIDLVPSIGHNLSPSVQNLNSAVATNDPGIEIEQAEEIRFRISQRLWRTGSTLPDWAKAVRDSIARAHGAGE